MRAKGGATATRQASIAARDHSASARSSMISPSISWRPSLVTELKLARPHAPPPLT
jgi:hypothetical protein